jgi:sterol desaturase/sphingolipid hydroxylase (fatty acid hydroxylase superfamily)
MGWEFCRPRRQREFGAPRRRLGNLGIWALNVVLATFTFAPPDIFRSQIEAAFGFALPAWPTANQWLSCIAGFLLLDFLNYTVHRAQHAVPFLWRFHALHHSDIHVDVTTSVRHHPIEYLLTTGFYWLAVLALGIPAMIFLSYTLAVFAAAALTHGNIRFPGWLERALQPVVITLDLHLIHHSDVYADADTNFGAVLSIWDRLFGTFTPASRVSVEITAFGVRELSQSDCLSFGKMLLTPWMLRRAAVGASD